MRYAKSICTVCQGAQINPDSVRIPYYQTRLTPDFKSPDIVIPTETAVFGYDVAGRMTQADNALVRIRRGYFPNGALKADTSVMRAYRPASGTSGFSGAHQYVLQYTYDSVGRRTSRTEGWGAQQTYAYDALGQLTATRDTVYQSLAVTANFTYDRLGRLRTQSVPGTSFSEVWTYDAEDRPIERSGNMSETVAYDIRGKRTRVDGVLQYGGGNQITMTAAYDGFGHLVATGTTGDAIHTSDEFTVDAFGNAIKQLRNRGQAMSVPEGAEAKTFADGRLASSTGIPYPDDPEREGPLGGPPVQAYDDLSLAYDFAGNVKYQTSVHYAWSQGQGFTLATGNFKYTWTFFDANGKPRYLQVRSRGETTAAKTDYNEYWYDALGRRVLAREYSDSTSGEGTLTRFAWDGDQLLREMRTPAGASATSFEAAGSGAWAGTRRYTQSGAIDTPLILWVNNEPRVVVRNWRGSAAGGTIVASNTTDTLVYPAATYDVQLAPDAQLTSTAPNSWMGSLITEQADASGLLYRRNRYYDPATGRFTQEDPIGLGGGMNLYGYAAGDPVNYHDPFGLIVSLRGLSREQRAQIRDLRRSSRTFDSWYRALDRADATVNVATATGNAIAYVQSMGDGFTVKSNVGASLVISVLFSSTANWSTDAEFEAVALHEFAHAAAGVSGGTPGECYDALGSEAAENCAVLQQNAGHRELGFRGRHGHADTGAFSDRGCLLAAARFGKDPAEYCRQ